MPPVAASPAAPTLTRGLVVVLDQFQAGVAGLLGLVVENDRRVRDVVEQRFHGRMEQRQPVLDAEMPASGGNRLVERVLARRSAEKFAIAGAEA